MLLRYSFSTRTEKMLDYTQPYIPMDQTALSSLICGCEWLVTDAKEQWWQTGLSTTTSREERGLNSFPTLAIPWVFYLPCETTNLSKSGLPPILLPRTNGEERGSHSRGAFPRPCHTSHKNPKGRGVKRANHCPLSTAPPFSLLWTQTLVWLFNTFEAKVKFSSAGRSADRATISPATYKHSPLQDAANSTGAATNTSCRHLNMIKYNKMIITSNIRVIGLLHRDKTAHTRVLQWLWEPQTWCSSF